MKYLINFHKPLCKFPLGLRRPFFFSEIKEKKYYFHGFLEPFSLDLRRIGVVVQSL